MSEPQRFVFAECFVLSRGEHASVCTVENGKVIDVAPLSLPAEAHYCLSPAGWIACPTRGGRRVSTVRLGVDGRAAPGPSLDLPAEYRAAALAIADDVLYVGGSCGTEVLGLYDLRLGHPVWTAIDVPAELRRAGKRIDDLRLDGDRLLAVDNVVLPKWLLVYDIRQPESPALVSMHQILGHGTYEGILRGAVGDHWVALLSRTVGRAGAQAHIAILDKLRFREVGSLCLDLDASAKDSVAWYDIQFLGDVLFTAAGRAGIAWLDLTHHATSYSTEPSADTSVCPTRDPTFASQCENNLVCSRAGVLSDRDVRKLIPLSGSRQLVAVSAPESQPIVLSEDDLRKNVHAYPWPVARPAPPFARPLHVIWVVDASGGMRKHGRIEAVTDAIRGCRKLFKERLEADGWCQVYVRVITFSEGAHWQSDAALPIDAFELVDLKADGLVDLGDALHKLAEALDVERMPVRGLPPLLILVECRAPTDDYRAGLKRLWATPWGKKSIRFGIALDSGDCADVLAEFIADPAVSPFQASSREQIVESVEKIVGLYRGFVQRIPAFRGAGTQLPPPPRESTDNPNTIS